MFSQPIDRRDKKPVESKGIEEEELHKFLKQNTPIKFDLENRWLKGEEYAHIIVHME